MSLEGEKSQLTPDRIKSFEMAETALKIDEMPEVAELRRMLPEINLYLKNKGLEISFDLKMATREDMVSAVELLKKVGEANLDAARKIEAIL